MQSGRFRRDRVWRAMRAFATWLVVTVSAAGMQRPRPRTKAASLASSCRVRTCAWSWIDHCLTAGPLAQSRQARQAGRPGRQAGSPSPSTSLLLPTAAPLLLRAPRHSRLRAPRPAPPTASAGTWSRGWQVVVWAPRRQTRSSAAAAASAWPGLARGSAKGGTSLGSAERANRAGERVRDSSLRIAEAERSRQK